MHKEKSRTSDDNKTQHGTQHRTDTEHTGAMRTVVAYGAQAHMIDMLTRARFQILIAAYFHVSYLTHSTATRGTAQQHHRRAVRTIVAFFQHCIRIIRPPKSHITRIVICAVSGRKKCRATSDADKKPILGKHRRTVKRRLHFAPTHHRILIVR